MKLFGIVLRRPAFGELTAAAVMAAGLWLAVTGVAYASGHALDRVDAGALLLVVAWACFGARLGLRIDAGRRHAIAYLSVAAMLIGVYQGVISAFSPIS